MWDDVFIFLRKIEKTVLVFLITFKHFIGTVPSLSLSEAGYSHFSPMALDLPRTSNGAKSIMLSTFVDLVSIISENSPALTTFKAFAMVKHLTKQKTYLYEDEA